MNENNSMDKTNVSSKEKRPFTMVSSFSGVGMQERGVQNTGLFDVEVLATCEMDTNAVISYAAIHNNLTPELIDNYENYPSREKMAEYLTKLNIGYDFKKKKPYDWAKVARSKDSKKLLQKTWLACKLNKNVGDICGVDEFPKCDLFTFSFPCFVADTKIKTTEGLKKIVDIHVGDEVVVQNKTYKVTKKYFNGIHEVGDLHFSDGSIITCTPNHKFLAKTLKGEEEWIEAKNLENVFNLVNEKNKIIYVNAFDNLRKEKVYDIEVEEVHRFVLENGLVAKNCTDLSVAGKQAGMVEGETRSGLVYEVIRILKNMKEKNTLPEFLLMENVDALVNKKNLPQYEEINKELEEIGYGCLWDVENAKYTGIPQNRNRVYGLYYLKDKYDLSDFEFPKKFDNGKRLIDVLEDDVDLKYYITNDKAKALIENLILNGTLEDGEFFDGSQKECVRQ